MQVKAINHKKPTIFTVMNTKSSKWTGIVQSRDLSAAFLPLIMCSLLTLFVTLKLIATVNIFVGYSLFLLGFSV